jgi:hypothetical protein
LRHCLGEGYAGGHTEKESGADNENERQTHWPSPSG